MRTEPSPDSSADNQLSLFIPTKDRSAFLSRLLEFYAAGQLGCTIHIGDASENLEELEKNQKATARFQNSLKIHYEKHAPGITTVASVHRLLEKIETPYAVFCGDDDYLLPKQLRQCVRFLQDHPDYSSVTGDQAEVFVELEEGNSNMKIVEILPGAHKEASQQLPSQRLLKWAYPAIGKNTFSVQPISAMRWAWEETAKLKLDTKPYAPLHELSVNVLTVLRGKQKHLKGLYHVMLRHTQKTGFSGPIDYFDRISHWDWPSKVVPAIDCWIEHILQSEKTLQPEAARRIAETALLQWLIPFLARNRDRKLKQFGLAAAPLSLRQRLSKIGFVRASACLILRKSDISKRSFLNPVGSYHREFEPIQRILCSSN